METLNSLNKKKINLEVSSFSKGEEDFFGIFISHSNGDNEEVLKPLAEDGIKNEIDFIYDRSFLTAGDDFRRKILRYINCYAGVSVITKKSINSNWVNYELGLLASMNIPLFIYDPEKILSSEEVVDTMHDYHIKQFMPAYNDRESLYRDLKKIAIYNDLFLEETSELGRDEFTKRFKENCDKVMIRIESDIFEQHKDAFSKCEFKVLLINFGLYDELDIKNRDYCKDCKKSGSCYGDIITEFSEDNKECCLLNKVLNTGKLFFKGDENIYENEDMNDVSFSHSTLLLHLPIHKKYGVTFKIIIDVDSNDVFEEVYDALLGTEFNPTFNRSRNGGRIYLSLSQKKKEGLYRCTEPFCNNYLCSYAIKEKRG